jgi:16S rRNA (cytidine1402-2'-O)-methyltransferase
MTETASTGVLYVAATPIGNLGDLSSRFAEVLRECDRVACEDTRVSGKLLAHLGVHKPMLSYRDDNELRTAQVLLERLLLGEKVLLMTDAGTPGVSDPGFRITRLCHANQVTVIPLPGPCAAVVALSASGLPSDAFLFLGFLPPKTSGRVRLFQQYAAFPHTLVFYESPHRIEKCMNDLLEVFGPERCVSVSKELTKLHERILSGPLGVVREAVLARSMKGEFVVSVAPDGYAL